MSVQEFFKGLRKWIDGEDDLDEQGQPKPRSKWEDFLVAIAREVEKTMQEEMFTPPGGPTYIPREYIVFLSTIDDLDWQGEKREGLQRGLYHVLSERARELVGDREFQTKTFTVELRVDAALEAGKFRVQHLWDNEADKTVVIPRKPVSVGEPTTRIDSADQLDEATIVRPRIQKEKLFSVLVIKNAGTPEAGPPETRPFYKNEITIGRGSKQVAVDLKLDGDLEISRNHATINRREDGTFTITCQGANPIVLEGGKEV
ncbi:MAG TPA: FhaA domain-containing protein, partial [Blastocatellia bacterium]